VNGKKTLVLWKRFLRPILSFSIKCFTNYSKYPRWIGKSLYSLTIILISSNRMSMLIQGRLRKPILCILKGRWLERTGINLIIFKRGSVWIVRSYNFRARVIWYRTHLIWKSMFQIAGIVLACCLASAIKKQDEENKWRGGAESQAQGQTKVLRQQRRESVRTVLRGFGPPANTRVPR